MGILLLLIKKYFHNPSLKASLGASFLIIDHSQLTNENVGVGMYPSLMGTFSCHVPIPMMGSSIGKAFTSLNLVLFHTSHMEDPWFLPSPSPSSDNYIPAKTDVPFLVTLVAYQANIDHVVEPIPSPS